MENCVKTVGTIRKRSEFLQSLKNEDKNAAEKKINFFFIYPFNLVFVTSYFC